jgi:large subunit ribosomal protein L31
MKKEIHPENYRPVIFLDNSNGERFLLGSTIVIEGTETDKWTDGQQYPVVRVDVSSASHPFYTGQEKVMDTAGRLEKFKARASKAGSRKKKA